jgi:hypothetical protein
MGSIGECGPVGTTGRAPRCENYLTGATATQDSPPVPSGAQVSPARQQGTSRQLPFAGAQAALVADGFRRFLSGTQTGVLCGEAFPPTQRVPRSQKASWPFFRGSQWSQRLMTQRPFSRCRRSQQRRPSFPLSRSPACAHFESQRPLRQMESLEQSLSATHCWQVLRLVSQTGVLFGQSPLFSHSTQVASAEPLALQTGVLFGQSPLFSHSTQIALVEPLAPLQTLFWPVQSTSLPLGLVSSPQTHWPSARSQRLEAPVQSESELQLEQYAARSLVAPTQMLLVPEQGTKAPCDSVTPQTQMPCEVSHQLASPLQSESFLQPETQVLLVEQYWPDGQLSFCRHSTQVELASPAKQYGVAPPQAAAFTPVPQTQIDVLPEVSQMSESPVQSDETAHRAQEFFDDPLPWTQMVSAAVVQFWLMMHGWQVLVARSQKSPPEQLASSRHSTQVALVGVASSLQ